MSHLGSRFGIAVEQPWTPPATAMIACAIVRCTKRDSTFRAGCGTHFWVPLFRGFLYQVRSAAQRNVQSEFSVQRFAQNWLLNNGESRAPQMSEVTHAGSLHPDKSFAERARRLNPPTPTDS